MLTGVQVVVDDLFGNAEAAPAAQGQVAQGQVAQGQACAHDPVCQAIASLSMRPSDFATEFAHQDISCPGIRQ